MTRAEIRRMKRESNKVKKKELKQRNRVANMGNTADAICFKASEQGKIDGRLIATLVIRDILRKYYRWSDNKFLILIDKCNTESVKSHDDSVMFVLNFYVEKLMERIQEDTKPPISADMADNVYQYNLEEHFFSGCAIFLDVLASEFSYGSNQKGTGRLDRVMDYLSIEYLKMRYDNKRTVQWYIKKSGGFLEKLENHQNNA